MFVSCPQEPTIGPNLNQMNPFQISTPYFLQVHFGITLIFAVQVCQMVSSLTVSAQNIVCIYCLHYKPCMPCPSYFPWFYQTNNSIFGERTKYEASHYVIFPLSCYFLFLWPDIHLGSSFSNTHIFSFLCILYTKFIEDSAHWAHITVVHLYVSFLTLLSPCRFQWNLLL